jgi:hypothetical protein
MPASWRRMPLRVLISQVERVDNGRHDQKDVKTALRLVVFKMMEEVPPSEYTRRFHFIVKWHGNSRLRVYTRRPGTCK